MISVMTSGKLKLLLLTSDIDVKMLRAVSLVKQTNPALQREFLPHPALPAEKIP